MSLILLVEKIVSFIKSKTVEKFTGKLIFTLHMNKGGIGRTQITVDQDL